MVSVYFHNQSYKFNKDGSLLNDAPVEFSVVPRQGDWIKLDALDTSSRIYGEFLVLKVVFCVDGLDNSWVNIVLDTDLTNQDFVGTSWAD